MVDENILVNVGRLDIPSQDPVIMIESHGYEKNKTYNPHRNLKVKPFSLCQIH